MTGEGSNTSGFVRFLSDNYDDGFLFAGVSSRRLTNTELMAHLERHPAVTSGVVAVEIAGRSAEGRPIPLISFGTGPTRVLMWSQMHGDEPSATLGLLDVFSALERFRDREEIAEIFNRTTVRVLLMLNPDGAERFQRRTGQSVDLNRDAATLRTPEARLLKSLRDEFEPEFGFNLHDQDPRYTVGDSGKVTTIAFLAPAFDAAKSDNPVRLRAKHLAAALVELLHPYIGGHIARYDDAYDGRSFGDSMQRWGTSTVLVESGGSIGDPEKMHIRKLNAVMLLGALHSIATGGYERTDLGLYETLPYNTKNLFDRIIEGVTLTFDNETPPILADLGINFREDVDLQTRAVTRVPIIADIGDLSIFSAGERVSGQGTTIATATLRIGEPLGE
jgi:hypothetical protein